MIQLGQQPEAGLRASEGRATGRLMLLHPKLSHSPRHGQRPLRPVWPGCLVARAAVRAVVCRWKKDPNQVKKAKNNLAASRVFLFVVSFCQAIVHSRSAVGSLEGVGSESVRVTWMAGEEPIRVDPNSQRCRESFALNHAVS